MDNQSNIFCCKHCNQKFKRKCNLEKHVKLNHYSETVTEPVIDERKCLLNGKINDKDKSMCGVNCHKETILSDNLKQSQKTKETQNIVIDSKSDIKLYEEEYNHYSDTFDSFNDDFNYSSDDQTDVKIETNKNNSKIKINCNKKLKIKPKKGKPKTKSKRRLRNDKISKRLDTDGEALNSVFVCNACYAEFSRICDLTKHVDEQHEFTKTVTRPFKCNQCGSDFIEAIYLRKHIYEVHGEKNFVCDWQDCQFRTAVHYRLTLHKQRHQNVKSNVCCWPGCEECFCTKKDLAAHIKKRHTLENQCIDGFKCPMCEQKLMSKGTLNFHIMAKHTNDRPFACDKCEKSFVNNKGLKKHVRNVHEEKKYKCDECKFRGYDKRDLSVHVRRVHLREKTVRCEYEECNGKLFFALKSLKAHYRNKHSDDRPYVCDWPECDATYKHKHELKKHIDRHFGK